MAYAAIAAIIVTVIAAASARMRSMSKPKGSRKSSSTTPAKPRSRPMRSGRRISLPPSSRRKPTGGLELLRGPIQGTSGVVVGEGSSLLVDLDSARQAELNFQAIRFAGDQRVRALTAQATLDRAQAGNVSKFGTIGAGTTLLGGLGNAATDYRAYQNQQQGQPKSIQVPATGGTWDGS